MESTDDENQLSSTQQAHTLQVFCISQRQDPVCSKSLLLPEWLPVPIRAFLHHFPSGGGVASPWLLELCSGACNTRGSVVTWLPEPVLGTSEVSGVHAQPQGP